MKIKNLLRIGSYPTDNEPGRGLHNYNLFSNNLYKTIYLTWFQNNSIIFNSKPNVEIIKSSFYTKPFPKKGNFFKKFSYSIFRLLKLFIITFHAIILIHTKKIDIIHIHSPMFIFITVYAKLFGIKNIITFHGEDFCQIRKKKWYYYFSKVIDLVFTLSPKFIDDLKIIHSCDVIYIHNGIDKSSYKNLKYKRKKIILAVSAFKKQKGLDYLINGFNNFLRKNNNLNEYKLYIVGDGILFKEINDLIKDLGLDSKIKLLGKIKKKELVELYNKSEIFILPSIWEGFPKVLLEAMSCGCKVISTKVDSSIKILKNSKYLIVSRNSDIISTTLKKAILNNDYPFEVNRNIVNYYTWDKVRNFYNNELKKIL